MRNTIEPLEESIDLLHEKYKKKFHIDHKAGMLKFEDIPAFWSRASLFYAMHKELRKLVGDATDALMHRVTRPHGRTFMEFTDGERGALSRDDLLLYLAEDLLATGWGKVIIEQDSGVFRVIALKGFPLGQQYLLHEDESAGPVDHYFLGYFEGAFSALDGKLYKGKEIECVAKGDDRCVFEIK